MAWRDDLPAIEAHYRVTLEEARVRTLGRVEFLRTQEILARHLPSAPAVIADIGGGPGTYALPLAAAGYTVHMLDPLMHHITRAREGSDAQRPWRLASAELGEARALPWADEVFDACLLFGPMYHLIAADERRDALAEARRVLRPGGVLMATAISRCAFMYAGLVLGVLTDPAFRRIVDGDLENGRHENRQRHPNGFTTAYCHLPDDFAGEIRAAGFTVRALLAVDGPAGCMEDLDAWVDDDDRREMLLATIRAVEAEPSLLGASPQFLAVARR